jgi:hypothetical protein
VPKPFDEGRRYSQAKCQVTTIREHRWPSLECTHGIIVNITNIRCVDISKTSETSMKVRGNRVGAENRPEIRIEQIARFRSETMKGEGWCFKRRESSYLSSSRSTSQRFMTMSASGPGTTCARQIVVNGDRWERLSLVIDRSTIAER